MGKNITIFGDGKQIRDVLHVSDLVRAYDAAIAHRDSSSGHAFNIGGGPQNTLSLLELLSFLKESLGESIQFKYDQWRPGDQKVFVCDISKANSILDWRPTISVQDGVRELIEWVKANPDLFKWLA